MRHPGVLSVDFVLPLWHGVYLLRCRIAQLR